MELVKNAIRAVIVWAGAQPSELQRKVIVADRAEKIAIYNTLLNQYWTWKLEIVKHMVVLNGLGLAASATVAASSSFASSIRVIGSSFWWFVAGLTMAACSMVTGMRKIQQQRAHQILALNIDDCGHPEMCELKIQKSLEGFIFLSMICFGIGAAVLFYKLQ